MAARGFYQVQTEAMNSFLSISSFADLLWKNEALRTLLLLSLTLALLYTGRSALWRVERAQKGKVEADLRVEEGKGEDNAHFSHSFGRGPVEDFLHIGYSSRGYEMNGWSKAEARLGRERHDG